MRPPLHASAVLCPATHGRSIGTATSADGFRWCFQVRRLHAEEPGGVGSVIGHQPERRSRKMARLEAVLFVADGALSMRRLAQLATLADATEARDLVDRLNESYDRAGCAFRIEQVATGCRLMTRPALARWLDRLHNRQARAKLSNPMMETLAIVAWRQPITRAEIEKVRGVQSAEMLKQLMERGLVRITGEEDSLGRPFLYGTTRQFLEDFGLKNLSDLPMTGSSLSQTAPTDDSGEEADPPADAETTDIRTATTNDEARAA